MAEPDFQLFTTIRYDPLLVTYPVDSHLAFTAAKTSPRGSPFYMLNYHRDRLLRSSVYFGWVQAIKVIEGEEGMEYFRSKLEDEILLQNLGDGLSCLPLRVKVILSYNGSFTIEKALTSPVKFKNLYPDCLSEIAEINTESEPSGNTSSTKIYSLELSQIQTQPTVHTRHKTTHRFHYDLARERAGLKGMLEPREVLLLNSRGEISEGSITTIYFKRFGVWVTPCLESGGQDGTTRRWALDHGFVDLLLMIKETNLG